MKTCPCALYREFPANGLTQIEQTLTDALDRSTSSKPLPVLFRADDIGVPSAHSLRLLGLFAHYRVPLCLAVVPAWLTATRWKVFKAHVDTGSPQWCWHQHGWRHANHQHGGKKGEFGTARPRSALRTDLIRGKDRLETVLGTDFSPFFTPPWNRCSDETLKLLAELDYRGISRSKGEQSRRAPLDDFFINVDLHTRKEADAAGALQALCEELRQAIEGYYVSIMIHHQLMNERSFELLEFLLSFISQSSKMKGCRFNELGKPSIC